MVGAERGGRGLSTVGPRLGELQASLCLRRTPSGALGASAHLISKQRKALTILRQTARSSRFHVRDHNDAYRIIENVCWLPMSAPRSLRLPRSRQRSFAFMVNPSRQSSTTKHSGGVGISFKLKGRRISPLLWQSSLKMKDKPYLQTALRTINARAISRKISNFGLQYPAYAHFTSPIRRYPDLLFAPHDQGIRCSSL